MMDVAGDTTGGVRQRPPWIQTQLDEGYRPHSFLVEYQKTTPLGKSNEATVTVATLSPTPQNGATITTSPLKGGTPSPHSGETDNGIVISEAPRSEDLHGTHINVTSPSPLMEPTPYNNTVMSQISDETVLSGKTRGPEAGNMSDDEALADNTRSRNTLSAASTTETGKTLRETDLLMRYRTGDSKPIKNRANILRASITPGHNMDDITAGHDMDDITAGHGMDDITAGHGMDDITHVNIEGFGNNVTPHKSSDVLETTQNVSEESKVIGSPLANHNGPVLQADNHIYSTLLPAANHNKPLLPAANHNGPLLQAANQLPYGSSTASAAPISASTNCVKKHHIDSGQTQSQIPGFGVVTPGPTGQSSTTTKVISTVSWLRPTIPWLRTTPLTRHHQADTEYTDRDKIQKSATESSSNLITAQPGQAHHISTKHGHQMSAQPGPAHHISTKHGHQMSVSSDRDPTSNISNTINEETIEDNRTGVDSNVDVTHITEMFTNPLTSHDVSENRVNQDTTDSIPSHIQTPSDNISVPNSTDISLINGHQNSYMDDAMTTVTIPEVVTMETPTPESPIIPCLTKKKKNSRNTLIPATPNTPSTRSSKRRNRNRKRMRGRRPQSTVPSPSLSMGQGIQGTHKYPMYPLSNMSHPQVYFTVPPLTPVADHSYTKNATFSLAGMNSAEVTGVAIGCIIVFWIILGPLVCILCRMRDKARYKRQERDEEDSMSHTLIEEMIRMELARGRAKMYRTNVDDEREIERLPLQADCCNTCNTCNSNGSCVINPQDYVIGNRYNVQYTPVSLTTVPTSEHNDKEYNMYMDTIDKKMYDTNL